MAVDAAVARQFLDALAAANPTIEWTAETLHWMQTSMTTGLTDADFQSSELPVDDPAAIAEMGLEPFMAVRQQPGLIIREPITTLPAEIGLLGELRFLWLTETALSMLPPDIGHLTQLQVLAVGGADLRALPPELTQLTALRWLGVFGSRISQLPAAIWALPRLTVLVLDANAALAALPPLNAPVPALEALLIHENALLRELPAGLQYLSNLRRLDVATNASLTRLPAALGALRQLQQLDLTNGALCHLPPEIGQLTALEAVDLAQSTLEALPPELGQLTNLRTLSLRNCMLRTLPPEIGQLQRLETLDLSHMAELRTLPPEFSQLANLRTLYMRSLRLPALPAVVCALPHLTTLDLNFSQALTTLPPEIGQLQRLETLDLRHTGLETLPAAIGQLTSLRELFLYAAPLRALPPEIGQLAALQTLEFDQTQIAELPVALRAAGNLRRLSAVNTAVYEFPPELGALSALEILNLAGTQVTELPPEIGQLASLRTLNLRSTPLRALPPEISQLRALEQLLLFETALEALPPDIGRLTQLQVLELNRTAIHELPASVWELRELQDLLLANTRLDALPEAVGALRNLKTLSLAFTSVSHLPASLWTLEQLQELELGESLLRELPVGIGQLQQLQNLGLRASHITALPPELRTLAHLRYLDLTGTAVPVPPEILELYFQPDVILDYYFQPARALHEAKIVLVGDGGVGKTSLVQRLLDDTFDPAQPLTEGIRVRSWRPLADYTCHLWDFGGQEILHATHQFFLTKRTLYVLVLNGRFSEAQNRVPYWLKLIESFGGDSPVLIVQNHADEHTFALPENRLRADYPAIQGFLQTSCKTGAGLPALREALTAATLALPHINDQIPLHWFAVKARIEAEQRDRLGFELYAEWCAAAGLRYAWEHERLLRFLHDLGVVLWFGDDPHLDATAVLNPAWVTDGIYHLIQTVHRLPDHGGVLDTRRLPELLDPRRYPRQTGYYLIDMLEKFELCFRLSRDTVLLPGLLPVDQPELPELAQPLCFAYVYSVLPGSILSRLMVQLHGWIDHRCLWRTGMLLREPETGNTALVQTNEETRRLTIAINGPVATRRSMLRQIRGRLELIHASFANLQPKAVVPLDDGVQVPYQHLLLLEEQGVATFIPYDATASYAVADLLDGISTPDERHLTASAEYQQVLAGLRSVGSESWTLLEQRADLVEIKRTMDARLAHLEKQYALRRDTDHDFAHEHERSRLTERLRLLQKLLELRFPEAKQTFPHQR